MPDDRFPAARPQRPAAAEKVAPPGPSRSSHRVMDRFRTMLRHREEKLRADAARRGADGADVPPPTAGEIVRMYRELLRELTFNSKVVITELTMIADEQQKHAAGIADAVCDRILEAPVDHKLPSLYLLDSIVKNVGHEYLKCFSSCLPKVFVEAYNQVTSDLYPSMRHLFGTWSKYFPVSILRKIEGELQFSTEKKRPTDMADVRHSESPPPRPSHSIHVNPKYLEMRCQLNHPAAMPVIDSSDAQPTDFEDQPKRSTALESPKGWFGASSKFHDFEHTRGVSSSIHSYGHKSTLRYGDVDFSDTMNLPSRPGMTRARSPQTAAMLKSPTSGVEGQLSLSKGMRSKPLSPLRIGLGRPISPTVGRFGRDLSPRRFLNNTSSSHAGLLLGPGRTIDRNNCSLERRWTLGDGGQKQDPSIGYNINNGYGTQHSRKLIDTYGDYRRDDTSREKHTKVQRLDVNDINNEIATRKWQSSEEDKYVFEDMSPTLADRRGRNSPNPFTHLNARVSFARSDYETLDSNFKKDIWQNQAPLNPLAVPNVVAERIPFQRSAYGSVNKKYLDGAGNQNEPLLQYHSFHHMDELGRLPFSSSQYPYQSLGPKSHGLGQQTQTSVGGAIPQIGQKLPGPYESFPEADLPFRRLSNIHTDTLHVNKPDLDNHLAQRPYSISATPVLRPPMHKSNTASFAPVPQSQRQFKSDFCFREDKRPILNQDLNSSIFLPQQKYAAIEITTSNSNKQLQAPYQPSGLTCASQQCLEPSSVKVLPQDPSGSCIQSIPAQFSSHVVPQSPNLGQTQPHGGTMVSDSASSSSCVISSVGMRSMHVPSLHAQGGIFPPLPPGPPPASSQVGPSSQNNSSIISSSPASALTGLYDVLIAKGLISLKPSGQSQDTLGVEFDAELLKVRHELVINSLYTDLPRQCTTCGLRFKSQEEHSNHMDWHVIKNRASKNRKQKPSRTWFVSAKEWLSGAERLGTNAVPGFLPNEPVSEKKEAKEVAVPADENQKLCALCGDPFEDFYSDETEEWMYKGAVYLNEPTGIVEGLDRSQLGPIVHSKCRSDPTDNNGQV